MAMAVSILTKEDIKRIHNDVFVPQLGQAEYAEWLSDYIETVTQIEKSRGKLDSKAVQQMLWEENKTSGAGMCSVKLGPAIEDVEFRSAVAALLSSQLPTDPGAAVTKLEEIYAGLQAECRKRTARMPWVKILRVLASVYPQHITCVIDSPKLQVLARGVLPDIKFGEMKSPIGLNFRVIQYIDSVLGGTPPADIPDIVKRSMFAWHLYKEVNRRNEVVDGEQRAGKPGAAAPTLKFLPQQVRTAGLMSISGYFDTALKILNFCAEGVTRAEGVQFVQGQFPNLQKVSASQYMTMVRTQLGLLKLDGEVLRPSALGLSCLDGIDDDPATFVIPRILTNIIGPDFILRRLADQGPASSGELSKALQKHYPRWTTGFAPSSLVKWAEMLGLIAFNNEHRYILTEKGEYWAQAVPNPLPPVTDEDANVTEILDPGKGTIQPNEDEFHSPTLANILKIIKQLPYVFPDAVVAKLHFALHAHEQKHFALLSGLSGTGKTKLAELYAYAYHGIERNADNPFFCLIPVQPDWTDPSGLLGYINPLQEEAVYEKTAFLRFLDHCLIHPKRPHFLCLDEMNLARVEYYLAPLLSAMETGNPIVIHNQGTTIDGVEPQMLWPRNLYIIGTVNMDETTYAFSDKVLDRAFTIEFWDVDLNLFSKQYQIGAPMVGADLVAECIEILKMVNDILQIVHLHFGYRTAEEVIRFVAANEREGKEVMSRHESIDHALFMKVLPKLRGQDTPKLRVCFSKLRDFAKVQNLPAVAGKVALMAEELEAVGATRFWR